MWEIISSIGAFAIIWFVYKYFKESSLGIKTNAKYLYNEIKRIAESTLTRDELERVLSSAKSYLVRVQGDEDIIELSKNRKHCIYFAYAFLYHYYYKKNSYYTENIRDLYLEKLATINEDLPYVIEQVFNLNMNNIKESYKYMLKQKADKLKDKE